MTGNAQVDHRKYVNFIYIDHRGLQGVPGRFHTYFALIGQAVWENMFDTVDGRRRRTPDHGYTISSLGETSAHVS